MEKSSAVKAAQGFGNRNKSCTTNLDLATSLVNQNISNKIISIPGKNLLVLLKATSKKAQIRA